MPIGLVAAGVGAAGAIGGAIISSNASNKAVNAQTQADERALAAQTKGADTATAEAARQFDISNATQREQFDRSSALQKEQFDRSQANVQPWLTTGTSALGKLAALYGVQGTDGDGNAIGSAKPDQSQFYESPDYNFRMSEGLKGIDALARARGTADSGATRKAAIAYSGNLASGEFNNYANRLAALAGVGQNAANNVNAAGQNYAQGASAAGATYANNISNSGSSYANTIGNIATGYGNNVANNAINQGNNRASSYLAQGNSTANAVTGLAGIASGVIQNNPSMFKAPKPYNPAEYGVY